MQCLTDVKCRIIVQQISGNQFKIMPLVAMELILRFLTPSFDTPTSSVSVSHTTKDIASGEASEPDRRPANKAMTYPPMPGLCELGLV
jgi:hypothetical protein